MSHVISDTLSILVWNLYGIWILWLLLKICHMWPPCYMSISNKFQTWLYIIYVLWPLPFCDLLGWFAWSVHNIHTCSHCVTRHFLQLLCKSVLGNLLHLIIQLQPVSLESLFRSQKTRKLQEERVSAIVICLKQSWHNLLHSD